MTVVNISAQYQLDWDIAQASQDINGNTSNVYGRLIVKKTGGSGYWSNTAGSWSANINGQNFSGSWTYDFRNYSELMLWQGNVTVAHNADGTKSISSSAYVSMPSPNGSASAGRDLTLSTIPRASSGSLSAAPVTGVATTVNISRASSSFTHDVTWAFGNASGTIGTGVGTSISWTPAHSLLTQIPNSATGTGSIKIVTKNGGTVIGTTSFNFTLTANDSIKPTLTSVTFSEAVTSPVNIASVIGAYVEDQSKLNYSFNGAAGIQGSSISSYNLSIGSLNVTGSSGVTSEIPDSGTVTISATVTDSRGRVSNAWTTTITVLAWSAPKITNYKAERALSTGVVDPAGTYIKITLTGSVSSLTVASTQKNTLTYRTDTSVANANSWTNKRNTAQGATVTVNTTYLINPYVETSSWDVRSQITDRFETTTILRNVPVAGVALDLGLTDVGIGKFWEKGTLDVGGEIYSSGDLVLTARPVTTTNWNNVLTSGLYISAATATGVPFSGAPNDWTGVVINTANTVVQTLSIANGPNLTWQRSRIGTTWGSWTRSDNVMLTSSGNLTNCTFDNLTGRYNWTSGTKNIQIKRVFTSAFRSYRILYQYYTGDNNGNWFRFIKGATQITTDYSYSLITNNGGSALGVVAAGVGTIGMAAVSAIGHFGQINVSEPMYIDAAANQKRAWGTDNAYASAVTNFGGHLVNNDTESLDGFMISLSSTSMNGIHAESHAWVSVQGVV